MSKATVFVIGHRKYPIASNDTMYKFLQVGSAERFTELRDNSGDNIAEKNSLYCELTGLYWGWKNDADSDIMGLVHYRRYFVKNEPFAKNQVSDILRQNDVEEILKHHEIIVRYSGYKSPNSSVMYRGKRPEEQRVVLTSLEKIIRDNCPEYLKSYYDVAYGYRIIHGNMFITKRAIYFDYCSWLFGILNKLEEYYAEIGQAFSPRQCGYVAEGLLTVYVNARFTKDQIFCCNSNMLGDKLDTKRNWIYGFKNFAKHLPGYELYAKDKAKKRFIAQRIQHDLVIEKDILDGKVYSLVV